MEKQDNDFYKEITAAGHDDKLMPMVIPMTQAAIRAINNVGQRVHNIYINGFSMNINGAVVNLGEKAAKIAVEYLRDQGFNVQELNGYYNITW